MNRAARRAGQTRLVGAPLTRRQREVLNAAVDEGSYAGAARALGVSMPTVKNTLAVAYRKLDVVNLSQAVKRLREIDASRPAEEDR